MKGSREPPGSVPEVQLKFVGAHLVQSADAGKQLTFSVASGVSRIIILRRAFEKQRKIREFDPTHVGCYVIVASGVSRIIILRRAFEKQRKIREFEPTHVGCYGILIYRRTRGCRGA